MQHGREVCVAHLLDHVGRLLALLVVSELQQRTPPSYQSLRGHPPLSACALGYHPPSAPRSRAWVCHLCVPVIVLELLLGLEAGSLKEGLPGRAGSRGQQVSQAVRATSPGTGLAQPGWLIHPWGARKEVRRWRWGILPPAAAGGYWPTCLHHRQTSFKAAAHSVLGALIQTTEYT